MEKKQLAVAVIALAVGLLGGYLLGGMQKSSETESSMKHEMNSMTSGLEGKTGDEFDKAFITEMIVHHEGAVEMAEQALLNAKHNEIKQMAVAIISAQTAEIEQMKVWLKEWYQN